MPADRQQQRLQEAARDAHEAEARGDDAAANEAWRRYRLISDTLRDPDELLADGIALSQMAIELAASDRGTPVNRSFGYAAWGSRSPGA